MSIYKRASGRYAVLVDQDASPSGARRRRSLGTFATRKEAERAEREAFTARDRGIELAPGRLTLQQLFERFVADGEARGLSGTTIHGQKQIWKRCGTIAALPVSRLRPAHLAELYSSLIRIGWDGGRGPLSSRSVGHTHALISTMLRWAVRLELAVRNVADAVEPPKGSKRVARAYQRDDALKLIDEAVKTRYGPLVVFGFETGLRRGELAGLKWVDVELERRIATIRGSVAQVPRRTWYKSTKTDNIAQIALSEHAIEALKAQRVQQAKDKLAIGPHYNDQGFVFASEAGGFPSPGSISNALRRLAMRAGLSIRTVHAMRHSTGSWLIRAGVDVRTVAAVLVRGNHAQRLCARDRGRSGGRRDASSRRARQPNGNRHA